MRGDFELRSKGLGFMLHENLARVCEPCKVLQSPRVITLKELVFSTKMGLQVTGLPR